MVAGNHSIACTVATEEVDCPTPLACYEVRDGSASNVSYSFCACLTSYGYTGAQCDERSLGTNLYLAFFVMLFLVLIAVSVPSSVIVTKSIQESFRKQKPISQMVWISLLNILGLTSFSLFVVLSFVGISRPSEVSRFRGMRATYLWSARQAFLFLAIFFAIVCAIFMSAIWYTTAMSSRKLRQASHFARVRNSSAVYASILTVVVVILFILELETEFYIYLAICGGSVIAFLLYSSFVISSELKQFSSSEDHAFRKILESIRHVTLSTAGGFSLAVIGAIISAVSTSTTSFRGTFMSPQVNAPSDFAYEVPVWVVGMVFSLAGLAWALIAILRYSVTSVNRELNNSQQAGSRTTSQVAADVKSDKALPNNKPSAVNTLLVTQTGANDH